MPIPVSDTLKTTYPLSSPGAPFTVMVPFGGVNLIALLNRLIKTRSIWEAVHVNFSDIFRDNQLQFNTFGGYLRI